MKNGEIKFETLKKSYKKYFIGGVIAVCIIGSALTFKLTHSKYRFTQSIDLAEGVIHYKAPDFKVMAMYINDGNGDVSTDKVPTSGYTLNTEKSTCKVNDVKDDSITINYHDGVIGIDNLSNKGTKCYIYFDKYTVGDYILANVTLNSRTPDFSKTATTDEGVYAEPDGMYNGTSYYWRGAATTNHVIFANKCWRIVRINGDKTIRLIYNGTPSSGTCTVFGNGAVVKSSTVSDEYYATDKGDCYNASYVGWTYNLGSQRTLGGTDSNAKKQTEKWYTNNLSNYTNKMADGKFCNDRNMASGSSFPSGGTGTTTHHYAAYGRFNTSKLPTLSCNTEDVYTLKVGAITADEVAYAGGVYRQANSGYYLKGDNNYWTMSPYDGSGYASVFIVSLDGSLIDGTCTALPLVYVQS